MADYPLYLPPAPPEPISNRTGFPVWVRPDGMTPDVEWSLAIFVVACCFGAAVVSSFILYYRKLPYSTHSLYHLIAFYCWATFLPTFVGRLITGGPGKFFSPAGGFHNYVEFLILFMFMVEGKEEKEYKVWWAAAILYLSLVVICIWVPWPYDALWFKFQGLVGDASLPIVFLLLWWEQWENTHITNLHYASAPVAALIHFAGNAVISICGPTFLAYYLYSMSYAIGYPLYAYFVNIATYKDRGDKLPTREVEVQAQGQGDQLPLLARRTVTRRKSPIIWPKTTKAGCWGVFILGLLAAGLTIFLGM